jgi:hypothetical protein
MKPWIAQNQKEVDKFILEFKKLYDKFENELKIDSIN